MISISSNVVSYLLIFWFQADVLYVLEFLCYEGSFQIIITDWILLQTFASTVSFHWGHISSRLTTESLAVLKYCCEFHQIELLLFSMSQFNSLTVWKWMKKLFTPSEHILLEKIMGVAQNLWLFLFEPHFWQKVTNHFVT